MNKWKFETGDYVEVERPIDDRRHMWVGKLRFLQYRPQPGGPRHIVNIVECMKDDVNVVMQQCGITSANISKGEGHLCVDVYTPPTMMYLKDVTEYNVFAIPEEPSMCYLSDAEFVALNDNTDGMVAVIEHGVIVHTCFVAMQQYDEDETEFECITRLRHMVDTQPYYGGDNDFDSDKVKVASSGDPDCMYYFAWVEID